MRIRKGVLILFVVSILSAAYLGFADLSFEGHDKILHFVVFFLLTGLFYWIWDSNSLRILRNICLAVCTLGGGVGSELFQGLLPYRTFDVKDIIANVTGSLIALGVCEAYHKKTLARKRMERLSRLHNGVVENFESQLNEEMSQDMAADDDEEQLPYEDDHNIPLREVEPMPISKPT